MSPLTATAPARSSFRSHTLDGAMLYFHPATGTHVRVANAATRGLRRAAPRVAMFGITNACNLACEFCSRDTTRDSLWTVSSAAALLRGLAEAGTLEVAFGGGEPFAFRGFPDLLAELYETTPLALNVTTNGTLLREPLWRRVRGLLGQLRMSIYPGTAWRDAADLLAGAQQLWGVNVLVDNEMLDELSALIAELAERGCHDVSLLSYVGPDRRRHLDRDGEQRLARVISESAIPCRVSVCFGARVPVPRLYAGIDQVGDCGAGYDFVSVTPDLRVQSCSFQDESLPGATADEVLAAWRLQQVRLAQPSPRHGCARALPLASLAAPLPPIAVWQAFSGNNSGECILVAKFETVDKAESFLSELVPGWQKDASCSEEWSSLFLKEGLSAATTDPRLVYGQTPQELDRIGRSVIAVTYDAEDAFPSLRAFAWKRGAFVVPGGVHAHDPTVIAAVRGRDRDDARKLAEVHVHDAARTYLHGEWVLVTLPFKRDDGPASLAELKELLVSYAGERHFSLEVFDDNVGEAELVRVKQRLGDTMPSRSRLFVCYFGEVAASNTAAVRFAAALGEERTCVVANGVLIDPIVRRKRAAVLGYRHEAHVQPLDGLVVKVSANYWLTQSRKQGTPKLIDRDALSGALTAVLPPSSVTVTAGPEWMHAVTVSVETTDPGHALVVLGAEAERLACNLRVWLEDLDPLAWAVRRLLE